ncbi:COA8 family protein CG14806, mitochondrial [Thrips palmi]|uniref:COA8 family protein CG14806, mitochondrial n=1 Tax=Thrips palmi TaxID=161013 RepID=A0A6P8ZUF0_THRPL|nr:COA8 family protein CG14806, mitochondrial [Thrips palmi]
MARFLPRPFSPSQCYENRCFLLAPTKFSSKLYSSSSSETKHQPPNPAEIKNDMIGPPNQLSNLRPVVFSIPRNESKLEREFRLERDKVQKWNEDFWIRHNSAFLKESNEFRHKKLQSSTDSDNKSLSAEEMSEYYKNFLDKNWRLHVSYNFQWYRKNFNLLYMAFKVQLSKLTFSK